MIKIKHPKSLWTFTVHSSSDTIQNHIFPIVLLNSWSHHFDSRRNINPVLQIGWIHGGLHTELDEPVRGGNGLPYHSGEPDECKVKQ